MTGPVALDVIIVSYRCQMLLRDCLGSLRDHPPVAPMRVHVIDNASGDGTVEMVRREFAEVELTESPRNLGFSAANNLGIAAGDAPFVLALNPDTLITAGALEALLELMGSHPEVGISGPRLERPDGSFDHASRRSFPTPLGALGHFSGLGRRAAASGALAQYRAPEVESGPVDAVNGAFMLIRRSALERVGAFDEGYWMYMEDLDLCYRFARAGWTTWFEPSVTVIHVKAGSSGARRSPALTRAFHYGMYRFYRAHYAPGRGALANAVVELGIVAKLGIALARGAVARATSRRGRPGT
ncbi:MAG: glycosyltransferase [Solirubrobacterales bacterium]|nr:glycosyltransferase [Solirubrobacterales bacterium]